MNVLTDEELNYIRKAGKILRGCLDFLSFEIKPGVCTKKLDALASDFIVKNNAKPAFRGYKGFPASICTSLNDVVVHGIPSNTEIAKEGDIISVDVGVAYKGCFADGAETFAVGAISQAARRLIEITKEALKKGVAMAGEGRHVEDISWAIQSFVETNNFTVVRMFVGHGIGRKMHQEPEVPNFGHPGKGALLKNGIALAIEPMVNEGSADVKILEDGWTAVTKDHKLSAHFEHTVIVGERDGEIIT
ncbi:MAG: type I methionyl aminopeptidase [Candidatus Omnitrophica bacterium]|nr:type I methionyl aminopeptidase [Candidatus Omnitrophota bacterium]